MAVAAIRMLCSAACVGLIALVVHASSPMLALTAEDYRDNAPATDRFTHPNAFPDVERTGETFHAPGVVYRRGESIVLRLTFYNPTIRATVGTFRFENPELRLVNGTVIPLSPSAQSQPITVPPLGSTTVTATMSSVPDYVAIGRLFADISVDVDDPDGGPGFWHFDPRYMMRIYLVDEEPVWPMNPVWLEVLDDSCRFAWGQSGEPMVSLSQAIVAHFAPTFRYNGGLAPQFWRQENQFFIIYRLREYLSQRVGGAVPIGDCRDVNSYLCYLMNSQGYDYRDARLAAHWFFPRAFRTNLIAGVGWPGDFYQTDWNFHQVVVNGSSVVFDACAAQYMDLNGQTYGNRGFVPANWPLMDYWQKPFGNPYFLGLVDGFSDTPLPSSVPLGFTIQVSPIPQ
jgi:hypothetical protein